MNLVVSGAVMVAIAVVTEYASAGAGFGRGRTVIFIEACGCDSVRVLEWGDVKLDRFLEWCLVC